MPRVLASVVAAVVGGCAVGAPPGFSDGQVWTFPLVAPLEDDLLLVPVYVADRAEPLLFMIDPDSRWSVIDNALASELKPYSYRIKDENNEADHKVQVFVVEIPRIRIGDLEVKNLKMRIQTAATFSSGGRIIRGIIGRDIISDSLIFAADRDRGVAYLAIQGALKPPPGAAEISFKHLYSRQVTDVKINGTQSFGMHLDLGARTSMLWPSRIEKAKLPRIPVRATLVDEYGTRREEQVGGLAAKVRVGGAEADGILILPFGDKRFDDEDLEGAVGQNFFSKFHVTVNWDQKKMWLKRRTSDPIGTARERIARWGGKVFAGCKAMACVTVEIEREQAAATGDSAPATEAARVGKAKEIRIVREGQVGLAYEVMLEGVDKDGRSIGQPPILATLPGGIPTVSDTELAPQYAAAAALIVIDVSPLPRPCDGGGRTCMWQMTQAM